MITSHKKQARVIHPGAEAIFKKALAFDLENRLAEAAALYRQALEIDLGHCVSWVNLGTVLRRLGQFDAALACTQRALELEPHAPAALVNHGNALMDLGRGDEALGVHEEAFRKFPADIAVRRNYAKMLREMNRYEEALAHFEAIHAQEKDTPAAWDRATALLHLGRMQEGWQAFESRWRLPGMKERQSKAARWQGEPLAGKTILVYEEQGFGDTILCARYLPLLKSRGARVILQCRKELHRLFASLEAVDHITLPAIAGENIDYHVPMMSLPGIFGTDHHTIPAPPRFKPPALPPEAKRLLDLAQGRFKVGVVWSGSQNFIMNHRRAVPATRFLPLAGVAGVQLFSLQKGPQEKELADCGGESLILPLGPHLKDFADTAAVVNALDLVVMTDSAVAHLAGAMGKPVWNLLGFNPYWLYQRVREHCPWYPSMKLFRQPASGNWDAVFDRVAMELAKAAAHRHT